MTLVFHKMDTPINKNFDLINDQLDDMVMDNQAHSTATVVGALVDDFNDLIDKLVGALVDDFNDLIDKLVGAGLMSAS